MTSPSQVPQGEAQRIRDARCLLEEELAEIERASRPKLTVVVTGDEEKFQDKLTYALSRFAGTPEIHFSSAMTSTSGGWVRHTLSALLIGERA